MNIAERVQEVFNRFNVNLTVTDNVELENKETKTDLAEATLDNGTVIYTDADSFAEGVEAYIINDEGENIALPPGEYTLADGGMITVGEGGVVTSVSGAESPAEEVEASEEVEAAEEEKEEVMYVTKSEVEAMIAAALESLAPKEEEMSEEAEQAEEPQEPEAEELSKEDPISVELAAVKAELEAIKKQAAEGGLKHKAPTAKREPLNLKNLTTEERVRALANHFNA
jgi:predicted DNA binding CopG/RHH family protein